MIAFSPAQFHTPLPAAVGHIPQFLDHDDPRPAREQIDAHYCGGWNPQRGFILKPFGLIWYPGDPAMSPLARAKLRDEVIYVYRNAWVCIVQKNGSFEVGRVD